jgi:O-antigen/teichoic acid export membrane protein
MNRIVALLLALVIGCAALAPATQAGVNVERSSSENPMLEVAKSTVYGGLAGLVLGSAVALVNNGNNDGDIIKWGFVGGTFLGFGYGLYYVSSRPKPSALLELENGKLHPGVLAPAVRGNEVLVPVVSVSF